VDFHVASSLAWLDQLASAGPGALSVRHCLTSRPYHFATGRGRVVEDHLLWMPIDGPMSGRVGGRDVEIPAGHLQWLQPGVVHTFAIEGPVVPRVGSLRFSLTDGNTITRIHQDRRLVPASGRRREAFDQMAAAWRQRQGGNAELGWRRFRGLLAAWLADLLLETSSTPREEDAAGLTSRQQQLIETWLDHHLGEGPTAGDLAGVVGLSHDYFTRCFRATWGQTPRRWLTRRRLERAAMVLIESHRPIKQIAADVGYRDARFFSRQFRKAYGTSPGAYRQKGRHRG